MAQILRLVVVALHCIGLYVLNWGNFAATSSQKDVAVQCFNLINCHLMAVVYWHAAVMSANLLLVFITLLQRRSNVAFVCNRTRQNLQTNPNRSVEGNLVHSARTSTTLRSYSQLKNHGTIDFPLTMPCNGAVKRTASSCLSFSSAPHPSLLQIRRPHQTYRLLSGGQRWPAQSAWSAYLVNKLYIEVL